MTKYKLKTPISEEMIRKLRVGDTFYVSGTIFTARDEGHRRALAYYNEGRELPFDFRGLVLYHCGPLVKMEAGVWKIVAAGPTTSTRMEELEPEFIKQFGVSVVIGKGGMGPKTSKAMEDYGAIYGAYTGGVAALAAKAIKKVVRVEWLDLGMPEALWVLRVENFGPMIVAIDSYGSNLYEKVMINIDKKQIYQDIDN